MAEGTRGAIHWSRDDSQAMFGVYVGRIATYRLVVEQASTPWEWLVWPVAGPSCGQAGRTDTAIRATRGAKAAVRHMDGKAR